MFAVILAFASCLDHDAAIISRNCDGNWSVSHELIEQNPTNVGNYTKYVGTYFAMIQGISMSIASVSIYQNSEDLTQPLYKFNITFHEKYVTLNENSREFNYFFNDIDSYQLSLSGKYHQYIFHYIVASNSRYQLSVFDEEKSVWHFFNIIKDIVRHDPTWWESQFWTLFGMFAFSICFSVLYMMHFKKYNRDFAEGRKMEAQKKLLPKPEFEDVLGDTAVRQRSVGPKE